MKLSIETNERLALSARVPTGAHMDAAEFGARAGIEFSADLHSLSTAANDRVRPEQGDTLISLDLHPETMRRLALKLLEALGTPAFTQAEWLEIAQVLRDLHDIEVKEQGGVGRRSLTRFADRIEQAYEA